MCLRLTLVLAFLLGGCAASPDDALPVCDGRDRRPANPYGSILIASPQIPAEAAQASAPTGGCA